MRKLLSLIIALDWILIQSCSIPDPKQEDFVGSWKAEDGAAFKFNRDGTFSSENLSGEKMFERKEYHGKRYSESGTWELKNQSGKWRIYLSFNKVGDSKGGVGNQLNVAGLKGITSNKPPWYLFKYVGDPDDGTMYEFRKI
jgi:hypothetical protein